MSFNSSVCSQCGREWPAEMYRPGHKQCQACQREKRRVARKADYLKEHGA